MPMQAATCLFISSTSGAESSKMSSSFQSGFAHCGGIAGLQTCESAVVAVMLSNLVSYASIYSLVYIVDVIVLAFAKLNAT